MSLQYLIESVVIYKATETNVVHIQGWAIEDDGVEPELVYFQND